MAASAWVSLIKFKDQTTLTLKKDSIVVFVGPNNSGKSKVLKEIELSTRESRSNSSRHLNIIAEDILFEATGSDNEYLERIAPKRHGDDYQKMYNANDIIRRPEQYLKVDWNSAIANKEFVQPIFSFLTSYLNTQSRLSLSDPVGNEDFSSAHARYPIQRLYLSHALEEEFSKYFEQAFNQNITVVRTGGSTIWLAVGTPPEQREGFEYYSLPYAEVVRKMPKLHEQGDGMRSFAGVFLNLFVDDHSINLIDEPEAFLHPPQISLLGKMIAKNIGTDKQVFISTHNEHMVKALLDNATDRIVVVRIDREDHINHINVLDNTAIKALWQDPLLRHSNILDGLFHKKVVVVESDMDIRFYSAVMSAIVEGEGLVSPDVLFVHTNGKHRFAVAVNALRNLNVPLIAIGDFDWYHETEPAKKVFELLGGDWSTVAKAFNTVKCAIDDKRPELNKDDLKKNIDAHFTTITTQNMSDNDLKAISVLLKKSSAWTEAKMAGKAMIPNGDASKAFDTVQQAFSERGLFILEDGEIESFVKTASGHGPKWVNEVLGMDILHDKQLEKARAFVKRVILAGGACAKAATVKPHPAAKAKLLPLDDV